MARAIPEGNIRSARSLAVVVIPIDGHSHRIVGHQIGQAAAGHSGLHCGIRSRLEAAIFPRCCAAIRHPRGFRARVCRMAPKA